MNTLGGDNGEHERLLDMLATAYWMEIETVMNYIASSVNADGVRAREVAEHLEKEIIEEIAHAQQFAHRIKELYGVVPGSMAFEATQSALQPPADQTDVVHIIKGVIDAESRAIEHYSDVIEFCEAFDLVTQDRVIGINRDEEKHRRRFEGFLREYEMEGRA